MKEKLIQTITLENSLILKIFDGSKKLAGDRWLVVLISRIEIPVHRSLLSLDARANRDEIKNALGEKVVFEQKRVRNFVQAKEKDEIFKSLCDFFLANLLPYLSHSTFPEKYVLKKYQEHLRKKACFENLDQGS
jgi:hypothetical protein